MKNISRKIIICISIVALFACQSVAEPDWYNTPTTNDPEYIVANGQGRNLIQAKKSALNQINSQLWMQINSSFESREVIRSSHSDFSSNQFLDNKINSKTATVTFTGINYTKIEKNDIAYFVEARVSKASIIEQLIEDIKNSNHKAQSLLAKLQYQDSLIWWLESRDFSSEVDKLLVRQAMLKSLSVDHIPPATQVDKLVRKISEVHSSILIYLIPSRNNIKSAQLLADQLSSQRIKTTFRNTDSVSQTLNLKTDLRQSIIGDAYISTQITTIKLQGKNGNTLASNEIISTGNSLSNYLLSKEGAERNFNTIINDQGLWESLGLK